MAGYLEEYTGNLKPATKSVYEEHIRVHLKPYLGDVMMSNLTSQMVQRVYNMLQQEKKLSPKSIKNIHGVFHRALEQAIKLGYLRLNPLETVILPRVEKRQIKAVEDGDMTAFLNAIKVILMRISCLSPCLRACGKERFSASPGTAWTLKVTRCLSTNSIARSRGKKEYKFSSLKNDRVRMMTVAEDVMDVLRRQKAQQDQWAKDLGAAFATRTTWCLPMSSDAL